MEEKILRPKTNNLELRGKLSYFESTQAWSCLNLRKPILDEFPELKEKISAFGYKMIFHHEYKELEKLIRKLKRDGEALPILMWIS